MPLLHGALSGSSPFCVCIFGQVRFWRTLKGGLLRVLGFPAPAEIGLCGNAASMYLLNRHRCVTDDEIKGRRRDVS